MCWLFHFKNIYFKYVGQPRKSCYYHYHGDVRITVRGKIREGRRVKRKSLSMVIPNGEVPSAKKKSASLEEQLKKASVILHH